MHHVIRIFSFPCSDVRRPLYSCSEESCIFQNTLAIVEQHWINLLNSVLAKWFMPDLPPFYFKNHNYFMFFSLCSCSFFQNALLDEQKSVMQKCAEERRKLAGEWSEFHTQQRLSKERTERDIDRALQIDSQREGAIMSLAKVKAYLHPL